MQLHYGAIDTTPDTAGFYEPKLTELDNHFRELVETRELQCASYLLSRNGSIFACRSMGRLRYDDSESGFLPDSIRGIASITKVFTSVAILQLIEQGKLLVDSPVSQWIEEFNTPLHRGITVFHLLTHTSGLIADPGYFTEPYTRGWGDGASKGNWLKSVLAGPLQSEPGRTWSYSSAGFCVLGEMIARISGMSYEDYILKRIVEPLGMERTFFHVPSALHDQVCLTADWDMKRLQSVPEAEDRVSRPPRAGGGLYSSLHDLWKLGEALLNQGMFQGVRILGRKTVEAFTRNHLYDVPAFCWGARIPSMRYGLGIQLREEGFCSPQTFSHEGTGRCALFVDPVERFVAVYMVPSLVPFCEKSVFHPRSIMWSGLL
ncbi:serine hydrolase domain-containing protein [Paenibacillus cymbidii]|uniref:serine hydrolase domain-containing protein n=1 Tax=Paenibacillus cymbidii TaxID=1639034 RepID=UPI001436C2F9|nr:serine hydrolase domain-containing protein [Paenibacillus cymbidii]